MISRPHAIILGAIMVVEGLVTVLSLGCWRPFWTADFRMWALLRAAWIAYDIEPGIPEEPK